MTNRAKRQTQGKARQRRAIEKELRRRSRRAAMRPAAGAAAAFALTISGVGPALAADEHGAADRTGQGTSGRDADAKGKHGADRRGDRRGDQRSGQRSGQRGGQRGDQPGDRRPTFADHRRDRGLSENTEARNGTGVGSTLFFTSYDPASGGELWKSDGTTAGTVLVKDINPGHESRRPR